VSIPDLVMVVAAVATTRVVVSIPGMVVATTGTPLIARLELSISMITLIRCNDARENTDLCDVDAVDVLEEGLGCGSELIHSVGYGSEIWFWCTILVPIRASVCRLLIVDAAGIVLAERPKVALRRKIRRSANRSIGLDRRIMYAVEAQMGTPNVDIEFSRVRNVPAAVGAHGASCGSSCASSWAQTRR
jgi:hypothetical protein